MGWRYFSKDSGPALEWETFISGDLHAKYQMSLSPLQDFLVRFLSIFRPKFWNYSLPVHHSNDSSCGSYQNCHVFSETDFIKSKRKKCCALIQADLQNVPNLCSTTWFNFSFTSLVRESILAWERNSLFLLFWINVLSFTFLPAKVTLVYLVRHS